MIVRIYVLRNGYGLIIKQKMRNKLKVLFIITKSEIGGAQTHLMEVVRYMHHAGHDVLVVTGTTGWLTNELATIGVDYKILPDLVREINPAKDIKTINSICHILEDKQPDIIHCHSSKAGIVGRIAGAIKNIPAVFTAHGWAFTSGVSPAKRVIYAAIEHMMLVITRKVICVSEFDRQLAKIWFLHNYNKIVTIHNGIVDKSFNSNIVREYSLPLKLVSIARFSRQKNNMELIRAVEQINKLYSGSLQLNMVGDGPLLSEAQAYVTSHKLENDVHFLGSRTDVDDILNQNDIFCLISNYEGLPISIIEAMRAGMPIIASDVGGVNELVQDEVNGFLIPRGNISELVKKLEYILHNRELIKFMGAASREIYEKEYTAVQMNQKIHMVYNEIITI